MAPRDRGWFGEAFFSHVNNSREKSPGNIKLPQNNINLSDKIRLSAVKSLL